MVISINISGPTYPDLAAYFKILKLLESFLFLVKRMDTVYLLGMNKSCFSFFDITRTLVSTPVFS